MRRKIGKLLCLLLCAALLCAAFGGCGKKSEAPAETAAPAATETPSATEKPAETEKPAATETPTKETEKPTATEKPEETEKPAETEKPTETEKPAATDAPAVIPAATASDLAPGEVLVSDAGELLKAIAPDTTILLAPGSYDLTLSGEDEAIAAWNEQFDYVKLRRCFDGIEIVVTDCDGLTLRGAGEGVHLHLEPRYADVLSFENCRDLTLANLTLGHTPERGSCEGSVVALTDCANVTVDNADLYGCGVYGLYVRGCGGSFRVLHSVLRDCEAGPFSIEESDCAVSFMNCAFTGSDGGGTYAPAKGGSLHFENCEFGTQETNIWTFRDDVEKINCVFGEVTQYPDIAP